MKKRSRVHRQRRRSPHQKALEFFAGRGERKRRTWTFERLEDRNFFSATPLNLQTQSISSATAAGAAEIMLREMLWQAAAAASTAGNEALATTFAIPKGPLLANQWHLRNIGQEVGNPDYQHIFGKPGEDINVLPVWLGQGLERAYTGAGVIVAVLDSGVQMNHPDLAANISDIFRFDAITGDNDPSPRVSDPGTAHGTAVAGIIAAVGSNNIGGSGIAPGATIAPIRLIDFGQSEQAFIDAFRFGVDLNNNGIDEGIDITNNSWGPGGIGRTALGPSDDQLLAFRDSIIFGRDGKGVIHVFASGNDAGPFFVEGFPAIGNYSSSAYNGWVNSRYTIGVTGVDHDGLYANVDGTFTSYPEVSAAVLVAAPTGSNAGLDVGQDTGTGSGIFTTDLVGDDGYNESPLPNGQELDRDFLDDVDYTSRFNGTSAAAPMVSGVIALMLEANPNLTWRDVQEILVRSARQNAQFEFPSSGALSSFQNTWQTNQTEVFRNPDPWRPSENPMPFTPEIAVYFPKAIPIGGPGHFEPQPELYTNGAGYTVSQGYGVYDELIGYGHGTVDAALAVKMAEKWHDYGQALKPELTFTSFVLTPGFNLPAAERGDDDSGNILVPGAIGGDEGFIEYWNQYFIEDDPDDPEDGPFSDYDGPLEFERGLPYLEFEVPDDNAMSVESVEVKVSISGPPEDLDFLRIMLVSPEGTASELNHFYTDPEFDEHRVQSLGPTSSGIDPAGDIDIDGGNFVWTFTTKRSWGERSSDSIVTNATTGDPYANLAPRGWRLYIENWSNSAFDLSGLELTWHGQSIQPNTQRVQGFVGIDENDDKTFNYSRRIYADEKTNPSLSVDFDTTVVRRTEVQNFLDLNQEKFAENILVEAYRVVGGVEEIDPVARFLTGADGNYYFDLVPGNYNIKVVDPMDRVAINDVTTPSTFLRHYKAQWNITEAWFKAADHDDATRETKVDATGVPVPFMFGTQTRTSGVKNVNFLLDPGDVPVQQIVVNGTVYADFNGNGNLNGNDTAAGEVVVYVDVNKNGAKDAGEPFTFTLNGDATRGKYTLVIPTSEIIAFQIGVERPSSDWAFADPSDGTLNDSGGPGSVFNGRNFFIQPPSNTPPGGGSVPGSILGAVFNDHDGDRVRDSGDEGLANRRVFVDTGVFNGVFDAGELSAVTDANGAYMISNVPAGAVRLEIEPGSEWALTTPTSGYHQLQLGSDGTLINNLFGLKFLATRDFGDLPDSYNTLEGSGGPWHTVVPGFQMGTQIDGEVVAQASSSGLGDDLFGVDDDDGIVITTNSGRLEFGANTLQVTLQGIGGLLNAWMDFNHDGDFNDAGERIFTNLDRNPGTYSLNVNILPGADLTHRVATRFRWGAPNLGVGGGTFVGEVEDYLYSTFHLSGDYNSDFEVDNLDRAIYWATFGSTTDLRADGNHNGVVDSADFAIWRDNSLNAPGGSAAAGAGSGASVFNAFSAAPRPSGLGSGNFGGFIGNVPASVGSAASVTAEPSIDITTNVGGPRKSASAPFTLRFAYSNFHFGQALETHVSTLASEQAASNADVDQDLLLLDQAWAALAPADKLDRAFQRTADDAADESMCASDLALAALFGDELDWRPSM